MNDLHRPLVINNSIPGVFPIEKLDVNTTSLDLGTAAANVSVDIATIIVLSFLAVTIVIQYFGKHAYRLIHALLCFRTPQRWIRSELNRYGSRKAWKAYLERQTWVNVILNNCVLFIFVRIFHECLVLLFHALNLAAIATKDDNWNIIAENYVRYPRRFFEAIVMWHYFSMYCLLIPIWLKTVLVWVSINEENRKRKIVSAIVYAYVVLTNIVIAIVFVPLAVIAIVGTFRPDEHASVDAFRREVIKYVCLPLECLVLFGVTCFTITFCTLTIRMVRNSMYLHVKNSKQVQTQKNAIVRLTIGMVFFSVCVAIRLTGYILYSAIYSVPDYVTYPLMKAIPDALFLATINIVFWPWRIPCVGAPITVAQEFSQEIKSLATKTRKNRLELLEPLQTDYTTEYLEIESQ